MSSTVDLGTILVTGVVTVFFSILVYYFKRLLAAVDKNTDSVTQLKIELNTHAGEMQHVKRTLDDMNTDIEKALLQAEKVKAHEEAIINLKRDIKACFRRIDELREGKKYES